ncbi:MAG: twin-arginine translocase TatA/TatE family subunit [Nitrospiraceae bacterium]|nr:MAG: twin-arginine translocase TatA/TatE family subunit [Nitrospiraceae bacterium]
MFDLGAQELIVIFIVAFLVFGPKRLPELGRTLGKGIRELKAALMNVKDTLEESDLNVSKEIKEARAGLEDSIKKAVEPEIAPKVYEKNDSQTPVSGDADKTPAGEKGSGSGSEKDA